MLVDAIALAMEEQRRATEEFFGQVFHFTGGPFQGAGLDRALVGIAWVFAGVPDAKIVELPGANLYMFLSNEVDVIREWRAFGISLDVISAR